MSIDDKDVGLNSLLERDGELRKVFSIKLGCLIRAVAEAIAERSRAELKALGVTHLKEVGLLSICLDYICKNIGDAATILDRDTREIPDLLLTKKYGKIMSKLSNPRFHELLGSMKKISPEDPILNPFVDFIRKNWNKMIDLCMDWGLMFILNSIGSNLKSRRKIIPDSKKIIEYLTQNKSRIARETVIWNWKDEFPLISTPNAALKFLS